MSKSIIKRKAYVDTKYCVACGVCQRTCPVGAISIYKGIYAQVNLDKCVGCSKCAKECPASVIEIKSEVV
ncbi:4Fe-4S dicluster domain-containing protein [Clostridium botulinum]|uniref:4Fe-4S dicluster domain-containing protein n=1 Tax=Clostridium botulinum TaxID=1491 RepID=UPI00077321B6|nr:4Fe-4S dicluster domain-containing protein [Clostridium botulinum]MBY6809187.1 4Fe-4S binding protein [Clostridium botulinum]MBY6822629.1 4Fe-4S binding protein [Clostridium botulinum]MBY6833241.1 4Fe-4S binding protein [Clostridium botulinum]MBY6971302.1 4Fe-4S binding protein [Clostridium botulinum]NFH80166.1 4Fe-4S ferredoxin [Clostridium botulinum]